MNKYPEISVIVPVYNSFDYFIRCMGSLLCQTYRNFEIILIDDGSSDGTEILCDEYSAHCPFVKTIHQDNKGSSAARNHGIDAANGKVIVFVDSDDCVHPRYLEILLDLLYEHDADIAMCGIRRFKKDNEIEVIEIDPYAAEIVEYSSGEIMNIFMRVNSNRCIHYPCGRAFRKCVLESDHFPVGISNGEDVEAFFKALLNSSKVVETKIDLYYYFKNDESVTGGLFDERYFELLTVWDHIVAIAEQRRPDFADIAAYNRDRTDFTILCDMLVHGNRETDRLFSSNRKALSARLRKNYTYLMNGPMTVDRKALLAGVNFAYAPLSFIIHGLSEVCRKTKQTL